MMAANPLGRYNGSSHQRLNSKTSDRDARLPGTHHCSHTRNSTTSQALFLKLYSWKILLLLFFLLFSFSARSDPCLHSRLASLNHHFQFSQFCIMVKCHMIDKILNKQCLLINNWLIMPIPSVDLYEGLIMDGHSHFKENTLSCIVNAMETAGLYHFWCRNQTDFEPGSSCCGTSPGAPQLLHYPSSVRTPQFLLL